MAVLAVVAVTGCNQSNSTSENPPPATNTDMSAQQSASNAWQDTKSAATNAWEATKDGATNAWNKTTNAVGSP